MTARWDRLPPGARVAADTRRKKKSAAGVSQHGKWRCGGSRGCGDVIEGSFTRMERHLDGHHGGRAEAVFTRGDDDAAAV